MKCTREYRLSFTQRAQEIVRQMTFEEKVQMMCGHSTLLNSFVGGNYNLHPYPFSGCERLGVETLYFCDGPRGVVSSSSTCFPVTMARGATFNRELEYEVGRVIGKEVLGNGGNYFGGVCMNIPYNPGAGRSQECYGEDSYHMGEMAVALMEGVQEENVIACSKHYAFNSMERSRFKATVDADKRTEREVYLAHFKKVFDHGCASVMNAYNAYQGEKCGHNAYLLRDVLKKEWDFDGFVMSDFMFGVTDTAGGISGGCDVEMHVQNRYKPGKVKKALDQGKITMEMIDEACLRVVRTTLAFQEARKDAPHYDSSILACPEHTALARRVAEESITLVKNDDNLLPLSTKKKIAFVGDLVEVENIGDHGSSKVRPPYVRTLRQAVEKDYAGAVAAFIRTKDVTSRIDEIRSADAVVILCGMNHGDEGEFGYIMGGDRESLELHKKDLNMIHTVTRENKNTAVIIMGGNVIMAHSWKDEVRAILYAYYPGMEGGSALADILFGKVNPSGRLPFAVAQREDQYPPVKWNTKQQHYGYWHGYQKIDHEKGDYDFRYGYGLSYTSFALSDRKLVRVEGDEATFSVTVRNTGDRDGADVPQVYIAFTDSTVERPVRTLAGFTKVFLKAGEAKTVEIKVNRNDLCWYDEKDGNFKQDTAYAALIARDEGCEGVEEIRFSF